MQDGCDCGGGCNITDDVDGGELSPLATATTAAAAAAAAAEFEGLSAAAAMAMLAKRLLKW